MKNLAVVKLPQLISGLLVLVLSCSAAGEVTRIEITDRETLSSSTVDYRYEVITGIMHFALDPDAPGNIAH